MRRDDSDGAWSAGERVSWLTMNGVAVVLLVVARLLSAGRDDLGGQVLPLNLAVTSLLISGAANVVFLLSAWRRIGTWTAQLLGADDGDPSSS